MRSGLRWLAAVPDPSTTGADLPRIALLVPAYEEQHRLAGLAERLCELRYPDRLLRIVFVTADAEPAMNGTASTADVAIDAVRRINAERGSDVAEWCSYPGVDPSMAVQLNHGLARLGGHTWNVDDTTYVGVIPADAYLHPLALAHVGHQVRDRRDRTGRRLDALQQPTTHLRTFDTVSVGPNGTLLRAAGVFQSAFALSVEMPRLRGDRRHGNGWRRPYTPLSGHGLFIRADVLTGHGGFPVEPWCEDIALTFGYYCRGSELAVVPSVEENESPLSWGAYLRQSASWFTGSTQFVKLVRFAHRAAPGAGLGTRMSVVLRRLALSVAWVGAPLLCWWAMVTLAVAVSLAVALVALVAWAVAVYWSQRPLWLASRPRAAAGMAMWEILAATVFMLTIAPLGPLVSITARLLFMPVGKAKTPHGRLAAPSKNGSHHETEGRHIDA